MVELEMTQEFTDYVVGWENWNMGFGMPWSGTFQQQPIWFYLLAKRFEKEFEIKKYEDQKKAMNKNKPQPKDQRLTG